MAEENLKTKGTEVEEETGFWNRLTIPLPERSAGPFRYLRDFFTCLEFLTRIRVTKRAVWYPDDFARSVPYFPLVGGIMGALMWGASLLGVQAGFSGNVMGIFLVLAELFFTGTLMYDGFMDTADGVFSGRTRERKLEIMQDSHVGANAVIGAVILILAKVTLLGSFPPVVLGPLLAAMYIVTRTLMVVYILKFPNARPGGLGEMFKTGGSPARLVLALLLASILLIFLGPVWSKLAVFSCIPCIALAFYLKWNLGGLTGDTFGFLTECGCIIVLFLAYCFFR
jgi:adenosylcobinamide-GDP ribazoletransferase